MATLRYQILALDVDGTVLDGAGTLRPRTAAAVAQAARAGIRPVLCTGRRYRRARPIAEQLALDTPLVCNSGSIIKDPATHRTVWRADFDDLLTTGVLELFHREEQPAVIFTDREPSHADFIVAAYPTGQEYFDDYVDQNLEHAEINPAWRWHQTRPNGCAQLQPGGDPLFHVCAFGTRSQMLEFQTTALGQLAGRVQTFVQRSQRYLGTMCEILSPDSGKWNAILHLAARWGVSPGAICAVGDDVNDIPMLKGAGLGVAMGHARPEVKSAADLITGDLDEDGVAMLVDQVLLGEMIDWSSCGPSSQRL
jgi:Cof subfamily protein (haloacid dehalogenase superfamily)